MIKFVAEQPALFIPEKKILVVADLHLGFEHELYMSGIIIPPQAEKFKKSLGELIKQTDADKLIILGDVKHEVPGISFRETREIPNLLSFLADRVGVEIATGNHDTFLRDIAPAGVKIHDSKGFKIGSYGFFHGHAWPGKDLLSCDWLFMGHVHPAVRFTDSMGYQSSEQVWMKSRLDEKSVKKRYGVGKTGKLEIVVFPTFNRLVGGLPVNSLFPKEYIGPLLSNTIFNMEEAGIYLLDGTFLGKIKHLRSINF